MHWNRNRDGRDMTKPVRKYRRSDGYVKECSKCGAVKPMTEFYFRYNHWPLPSCKECVKAQAAAYRARKAAQKRSEGL